MGTESVETWRPSRRRHGRIGLAVPVFLLSFVAVTAGCGSNQTAVDGSPSGAVSPSVSAATPQTTSSVSDSPAPASWADCATVWKAGSSLPVRYPGCAQAGAAVPVHKIACSSGQEMVTYGDHYFAVPGGTITQTTLVLRNSPVYAAAIGTCRG